MIVLLLVAAMASPVARAVLLEIIAYAAAQAQRARSRR